MQKQRYGENCNQTPLIVRQWSNTVPPPSPTMSTPYLPEIDETSQAISLSISIASFPGLQSQLTRWKAWKNSYIE